MKLLALMCMSYDGDICKLFIEQELRIATDEFNQATNPELYHMVVLARVDVGVEFGSGSRGDFYGGEVLEQWTE